MEVLKEKKALSDSFYRDEVINMRLDSLSMRLDSLSVYIQYIENLLAPLSKLEALIERIEIKQERIEEEQKLFRNYVYERLPKKEALENKKRTMACEDPVAWNYPAMLSGWSLYAKKKLN